MPVDVFHYHDGIIHHQADSDNHGQQGKQVDGKIHGEQKRQHTYQRQGDGNQGYYNDAQGPQKQVDDQDNDDACFDQGDTDLPQGLINGNRAVSVEFHLQIRREGGCYTWHGHFYGPGDVQWIGIRCRCNGYKNSVAATGKRAELGVFCR